MRYGMMIELDKCIGCQACVSACKERWDSGPGAARSWVMEFEHGRRGEDLGITLYPGLCNHCADHPCTSNCPTGATYVDERGVVKVDPEVCVGCGNCIAACPYGARHVDERKKIVEKCNFCAPYLARGEEPACVSTCLAECRHFGDLDDPGGELAQLIQRRQASPLATPEVAVGSKVYYAPADRRERLLENNVIKPVAKTRLTRLWQGYTRPAARYLVPGLALVTGAGGLLANLIARRKEVASSEGQGEGTTRTRTTATEHGKRLTRHRLGMRFLHWFNLVSWLVLLISGTALMVAPSFAVFGAGLARRVAELVGGSGNLIRIHVIWGLVWAMVIVPLFLYLKRGGIEALREILPTRDDLRWLARKPFVMLGLSRAPLPPQDKYNAGQKAFALSALLGTTMIIASGVVMTFHVGPPAVIRAAILVHKLAILLALVGLAVHVTMAAVIADERPALRSMLSGSVDLRHARAHSSKWVEELEQGGLEADGRAAGGTEEDKELKPRGSSRQRAEEAS